MLVPPDGRFPPATRPSFAQRGFGVDSLLYRPDQEHDACGVGFVADTTGTRSNRVLQAGLRCVANLTHRGAVDADAKTGDGAGVQTQIPVKLFRAALTQMGVSLADDHDLAVGMVFLPHEAEVAARCRAVIDACVQAEGLHLLGWRQVPVDQSALGRIAAESQPAIMQILGTRAWWFPSFLGRFLPRLHVEPESAPSPPPEREPAYAESD